jgi:hypothetical protein
MKPKETTNNTFILPDPERLERNRQRLFQEAVELIGVIDDSITAQLLVLLSTYAAANRWIAEDTLYNETLRGMCLNCHPALLERRVRELAEYGFKVVRHSEFTRFNPLDSKTAGVETWYALIGRRGPVVPGWYTGDFQPSSAPAPSAYNFPPEKIPEGLIP